MMAFLPTGVNVKIQNNDLFAVNGNVPGVSWPPVTAGTSASLTTLMHQLAASERLDREAIQKRQYEQLEVLAEHCRKHSQHFEGRLKAAGLTPQDISTPEGLQRLPVMTRGDIQRAGDALFCRYVPPSHMPMGPGRSSGSTGEPVTIMRTAVTELFWQAFMLREHFWHERDLSERLLVIRSSVRAPVIQKGWGPPASLLYATGDVMGMPVTLDVRQQLKAIMEFRPQQLNLHPSTLAALMSLCDEMNIRIDGIKHIWLVGEASTASLREKAKNFFGASIEDVYSLSEVGIVALQCPYSGKYHVMAENLIVEILREDDSLCADGETGRVVVTDLHNFATPVIRYELGDLAEAGGCCGCGRTLPVLNRIIGRTRNLIIKPDGTRHWPPITNAIFDSGLPIVQFQLIQQSVDKVEVRLVTRCKLTIVEENGLREHLHRALGHPFALEFIYFEGRLPLPASGKFEDLICNI